MIKIINKKIGKNYLIFISLIIILLFSSSVYGVTTLTDNLVSYYTFDSDATDSLGINDGTNIGGINQESKINNGYEFNGTGANVDIPNITTISNALNYSVSLWYKTSDTSTERDLYHVIKTGTNKNHLKFGANNLYGCIYEGGYTCKSQATTDTASWHHVVVIWDATQNVMTMYFDNVSVSGTSTIGSPSSEGASIGGSADGLYEFFNGSIDEVGIWNRTLTITEVNELYNSDSGNQYPFEVPSVEDIKRVSKVTFAPSFLSSFSTLIVSPVFTLYCFPPVLIIAILLIIIINL